MYCRTSEMQGLDSSFSNREIFVPTFKPDKILSATGAGDTSIAAFLTSMINGEKLDTCLDLAAGAGALCVSSYDALSGLKSLDEIKEKIEKGWERNKPCL